MKLEIPSSFSLFGKTIIVEYVDNLVHEQNSHGFARFRDDTIQLQPSSKSCPLRDDTLYHNFLHEVVHHIFYLAGEDSLEPPLHKREYLVDRVAGLFHQFLRSVQNKQIAPQYAGSEYEHTKNKDQEC